MKKEKSCGAIVYKIENNEIYILLIKHNIGHWSFPKGHVENNETEIETAIREIKEETNLDVNIDSNFKYMTTYSPKENIIKDVVYFLAIPINDKIIPQEAEIEKINWYNIDQSLNTITYESDKNILKAAIKYIKDNKLSL